MPRTHHFHLDVGSHSVTVQTRHAPSEAELLVDGKVVGYQRTQHRNDTLTLTAELPGDPPRPFDVTLHTGRTAERSAPCMLEIAGRRHPMAEIPLGRSDGTLPTGPRPALRSARRLLRSVLRRTHRR
ncbi:MULTISPECIES: hypothetical protein [Streptomyces]|uniref:hypothetical protein n=1 Tax=Streptomyces TaxID=1883 RepID=UPI001CE25FDA|nr:hypothetical protein [Streptomyces solaniscabiei]